MSQTEPVEARSLAAIHNLAESPPAYPRNPTHVKKEPLVLYIVRVPGKRDLFLSPLKPETSNISKESLDACLYYLHVHAPEDEHVLRIIEQEKQEAERQQLENRALINPHLAQLNRIQRKPVPGTAAAAAAEEAQDVEETPPPLPRRPAPPVEIADTRPPSYDVAVGIGADYESSRSDYNNNTSPYLHRGYPDMEQEEQAPALPPRPLPARPPEPEKRQRSFLAADLVRGAKALRRRSAQPLKSLGGSTDALAPPPQGLDPATAPGRSSWDGGRPSLRPRSSNSSEPSNLNPSRQSLDFYPPWEGFRQKFEKTRENSSSPPAPYRVTLIRRIANGPQWNVGEITNRLSDSQVTEDNSFRVVITTRGYNKFINNDKQPISLESLMNIKNTPPAQQPPSSSSTPENFVRNVNLVRTRPPHRSRGDSPDSGPTRIPNPWSCRGGQYTFTSPWNGICAFALCVNGRSLKLKHTILPAGMTWSSYNTNNNNTDHHYRRHSTSTPSTSSAPPPQPPEAVTVAEIRPNHPPFMHGNPTSNHNQQQQSRPSSSYSAPPSPPTVDPDRLDLSLARERAGGGFRGKDAKLGKLIIEDEGQKMLDLVVAACMGAWWGTYENGRRN
ncbi:hypothetical protein AJ80_05349 [Polytolypa hystricis UAMH7299]|uniref:Uncharacterized protein n=1 Tax=Polytolypa hystricis (strain UAMH7299) TaxID=1447883 RepID=A0A2B7Y4P4_POLH7|nr:hypothetical protein AJ80_05349 [Polytolypa hystricis UAMH7299]